MKRIAPSRIASRAIAFALTVAASGVAAGQRGAKAKEKATAASGISASISRIPPCSLLTKDEVQHQVELSLPSGKADRLRSEGVVWSITMQPTPRDASRACQIAWRATVNGEVQSRGEFSLVVTFAGWLTGSVAGMSHPLPIPNLGDEAYFVGGKSGPPYARVGDIAIGIENFPDTKESKSGLDLLRAAVLRARAKRTGETGQ
jgi:hypothetical protein